MGDKIRFKDLSFWLKVGIVGGIFIISWFIIAAIIGAILALMGV